MLTLVYAQDQAGGIGYQNQLLLVPSAHDLKFFKQVHSAMLFRWGKTLNPRAVVLADKLRLDSPRRL